jgi:hypothetical protein
MLKENIKGMLNKGASLDEIIIAIIDILDEATNIKDGRNLACEFISSTIHKLNEQALLIKEQHQLGVHMDTASHESDEQLSVTANAGIDFYALEREIEALELHDDIIAEMEVLVREKRNGLLDANELSDYFVNLHSIYDGFDIEGRPENATFALYISTSIN